MCVIKETSLKKVIEIQSFNPYENRFPNRKVISRETLILIKYLRAEGYQVKVLPENIKKTELLYRKGLTEIFTDPLIMILLGIPIGVITNIISDKIQNLIRKLKTKEEINPNNLIIKVDNSTNYYNYLGNEFPKDYPEKISKKKKKIQKAFTNSFEIKPPNANYLTPIFLEHKPKIVGWCSLFTDDQGLKAEGFLTDKIVKKRIKQNRLNGMSVTGIAKKTRCSICNKSYVKCNHVAGEVYEGKKCHNTIVKTDFVETSIVKEPINKECLVNMV